MEMNQLKCGGCGKPVSPEVVTPWTCECGSTIIQADIGVGLSGSGSLSADGTIGIGSAERDWKQRWSEIKSQYADLCRPYSGTHEGSILREWRARLLSFYVSCYHLKDSLKKERPGSLARMPGEVERQVDACFDLKLLGDLANKEKHCIPGSRFQPKTGHWPNVGDCRTVVLGSGEWKVQLDIEHNGSDFDGLSIAKKAIDEWNRLLVAWGLAT